MDPRRWRIAAVVVVGVVLVAAPLVVLALGDEGGSGSETEIADGGGAARLPVPDSGGPAEMPDPGLEATGDEVTAFVAEAVSFVEEVRGQDFLEQPVVVVVPDDEFEALLDADLEEFFAEDPGLVEEFTVLYRALRLIDADESIDDEYRAFGGAGVLGFYDPETDELVVREGDGLSLLTKSTIVHELTHAFDDQRFDLDRSEYDDRTDEIGWTFSAVVEGSASHVETAWEATLPDDDRTALELEELSFGDDSDFAEFTYAFLVSELSVYLEGEPYVDRLVRDGGVAALDAALTEPPATSEQVMEERRADEAPVAVPLPPADGEIISSGNGGQVLIESLLVGVLPPAAIAAAGEGWGGDAYVAWRDGDLSCIRWDLVADTPDDLDDLGEAMKEWAAGDAGASVSVPSPGVVRVESCV